MNKKILIGISIIIVSIMAIVLAITMFIGVPDVMTSDELTMKQSLIYTSAVMLAIIGIVGVICGFVYILTEFDS